MDTDLRSECGAGGDLRCAVPSLRLGFPGTHTCPMDVAMAYSTLVNCICADRDADPAALQTAQSPEAPSLVVTVQRGVDPRRQANDIFARLNGVDGATQLVELRGTRHDPVFRVAYHLVLGACQLGPVPMVSVPPEHLGVPGTTLSLPRLVQLLARSQQFDQHISVADIDRLLCQLARFLGGSYTGLKRTSHTVHFNTSVDDWRSPDLGAFSPPSASVGLGPAFGTSAAPSAFVTPPAPSAFGTPAAPSAFGTSAAPSAFVTPAAPSAFGAASSTALNPNIPPRGTATTPRRPSALPTVPPLRFTYAVPSHDPQDKGKTPVSQSPARVPRPQLPDVISSGSRPASARPKSRSDESFTPSLRRSSLPNMAGDQVATSSSGLTSTAAPPAEKPQASSASGNVSTQQNLFERFRSIFAGPSFDTLRSTYNDPS